jgi:hypothetical protein
MFASESSDLVTFDPQINEIDQSYDPAAGSIASASLSCVQNLPKLPISISAASQHEKTTAAHANINSSIPISPLINAVLVPPVASTSTSEVPVPNLSQIQDHWQTSRQPHDLNFPSPSLGSSYRLNEGASTNPMGSKTQFNNYPEKSFNSLENSPDINIISSQLTSQFPFFTGNSPSSSSIVVHQSPSANAPKFLYFISYLIFKP